MLPRALQVLHDAPGPSGLSPFKALFGRDRLGDSLPLPVEKECEDASQWWLKMRKQDEMVATALEDLVTKRCPQNTGHKARFCAGDNVWVLRPRVAVGDKVEPRWVGPCKVVQQLGAHTWRVQTSPSHVRDVADVEMKLHHAAVVGPSWTLWHRPDSPM